MSMRRLTASLGLCAALGACTENVTAPGLCPEFCPAGSLTLVDTMLATAIGRDSSYRGFVVPHEASALLAADLPTVVDSRPVVRTGSISPRLRLATTSSTDTTTGPVTGVDSLRLRVLITRRDTAARNLTLKLYLLPLAVDSATGFAALAASFSQPPVRTLNVDSLLARPGRRDPVTRDSVFVDASGDTLTVLFGLDSVQAPYVPADSGKLALGIRVAADARASIALGSSEAGAGTALTWYLKLDSLGTVAHRSQSGPTVFDSFVFDPPAPALDANLTVGGTPSARSIVRVSLPRYVRDSTEIVRATLLLVPSVPARGAPADSFVLAAHGVRADFGAKSPLALDSLRTGTVWVRIGSADTVRVELTRLLRSWAADTLAPTALVLRQLPEGGSLAEIRFHPSGNALFRPALQVTYLPRFRVGGP